MLGPSLPERRRSCVGHRSGRIDCNTSPWGNLLAPSIAGVPAPDSSGISRLAASLVALCSASRARGDTGAEALYAIGVLLYHLRERPMDSVEAWLGRSLRKARSPELQGRIAYMGARAELENYYARKQKRSDGDRDTVVHAHRWFALLRRKAAQTDYYQEWFPTEMSPIGATRTDSRSIVVAAMLRFYKGAPKSPVSDSSASLAGVAPWIGRNWQSMWLGSCTTCEESGSSEVGSTQGGA